MKKEKNMLKIRKGQDKVKKGQETIQGGCFGNSQSLCPAPVGQIRCEKCKLRQNCKTFPAPSTKCNQLLGAFYLLGKQKKL